MQHFISFKYIQYTILSITYYIDYNIISYSIVEIKMKLYMDGKYRVYSPYNPSHIMGMSILIYILFDKKHISLKTPTKNSSC